MAVGKLSVTPETVRGLPSGFQDAKLFVGCYVQETEKHRTHAGNGSIPSWDNTLVCNVPEGQNYLHLELVNESPVNGGILAKGKVALNQVFSQGREQSWVPLDSTTGNAFGELKLNLTFNGTNSVSSVSSSFGDMNLTGGQHVSYQQTTTHSQTTSHQSSQSDSRQSSFASLGPANPIPQNYGSGSPPPFTPPAAVSYPGQNGNNTMPGSAMPGSAMPGSAMPGSDVKAGLVGADGVVNPESMTKGEFEEAKSRGTIPTWAKYGGGALAGIAAIGLSAWGAHELKEHFDNKEEEEKQKQNEQKKHDEKPFVPPAGYLQQQGQQQPYTIHNQPAQPAQPAQQQHKQQTHVSSHENKEHKSEHKKDKKEKKDKKDKKDKKSKKHGGSGSSSSSSSSSDSDSDDDHKKKDKHHKKKDSDWK